MTDEEYTNLLDRIIKGAYYLAHPMISKQDFERGIKLYDELCARAREYRGEN